MDEDDLWDDPDNLVASGGEQRLVVAFEVDGGGTVAWFSFRPDPFAVGEVIDAIARAAARADTLQALAQGVTVAVNAQGGMPFTAPTPRVAKPVALRISGATEDRIPFTVPA